MSSKKVTISRDAELIRDTREKLRLSRREFADQLYVTEKYIYLIETGRKPPTQRFKRMLGLRFGVQIARIQGDIPPSEKAPLDLLDWMASDVNAQNFFRVWQELGPSDQEAVRHYAESIRAGDEETKAFMVTKVTHRDELIKTLRRLLGGQHVRKEKG